MGDEKEPYCRLCAEPTPKEQLILPDEDVAVNSKISAKMQWINVDITHNNLPTTICFSCFDLLERTWSFLHNVRSAQEKLCAIFKVTSKEVNSTSSDVKTVGKPVDKNWQEFQNTKPEFQIKEDPEESIQLSIELTKEDPEDFIELTTVDPSLLLEAPIKIENYSDDFFNNDGFNTTDSDMPLQLAIKQKKLKKKKKFKKKGLITEDLLKPEIDIETLGITSLYKTWEDYMCRCAYCDALCKNISSLRLHAIQIHSRCCSFKCSDCGKVIANFKNFVNHVRGHKNVLRYCCEYCDKQFSLTAYVKKHINAIHSNASLMTCQNCGAYFETEELLQDHLVIYSKSVRKIRKSEKDADLRCKICNKEFKSRSNLQQHTLTHTERAREFSCHVCGKMFFTKGTLSTHMSTHEDTKPFKCEFCPLAFRARGNLQSHISLHSGAKPFVCEQCGKSFRVKRHLKSHSIVHTDLMPYICQYCNKPFRFKTRLNLHLRQHTGAKPYTCVYCQRDFTNGSNFKKHMKRRHNVDTSRKKYNNIVDDAQENSEGHSETV